MCVARPFLNARLEIGLGEKVEMKDAGFQLVWRGSA